MNTTQHRCVIAWQQLQSKPACRFHHHQEASHTTSDNISQSPHPVCGSCSPECKPRHRHASTAASRFEPRHMTMPDMLHQMLFAAQPSPGPHAIVMERTHYVTQCALSCFVSKRSRAVTHSTSTRRGHVPAALSNSLVKLNHTTHSSRVRTPVYCERRELLAVVGATHFVMHGGPDIPREPKLMYKRMVVCSATSILAGTHVCRVSYDDKLQWYTGDHGLRTRKTNCQCIPCNRKTETQHSGTTGLTLLGGCQDHPAETSHLMPRSAVQRAKHTASSKDVD
jgi:hypothetical protein